MKKKTCEIKTKTSYDWPSNWHEFIYETQKALCDITGKGCKATEDFKERYATKVENKFERCQ